MLLLTALSMVVLLGMAALAIDVGVALVARRSAQNAADAAAVAGANSLATGGAAAEATAVAQAALNHFSAGNGVTVDAVTPPTSGPRAGDADSMEVVITKAVPAIFAVVFSQTSFTVEARAVATLDVSTRCVICVLDPTAGGALSLTGNGNVTVNGGGVVVNSSAANAIRLTGNGSITAQTIKAAGGVQRTGNGGTSPAIVTGATPVVDPLAAVPAPVLGGPSGGAVRLNGNDSRTIGPGIYSTLDMSGNGSLTLQPGVYVITGPVQLTGNGNLIGNGVTMYFACSAYPAPCNSGQTGGSLQLTGNGSYRITAPASGTYQGLAVFYDRNNAAQLSLTGNGSNVLQGTIYAKSAPMTLTGNGGTSTINSLIVVDGLTLTGNGHVVDNFTKDQNYPVKTRSLLSE